MWRSVMTDVPVAISSSNIFKKNSFIKKFFQKTFGQANRLQIFDHWSKRKPQIYLKYFVNLWLTFELFSKALWVQTNFIHFFQEIKKNCLFEFLNYMSFLQVCERSMFMQKGPHNWYTELLARYKQILHHHFNTLSNRLIYL